MVVRMFVLLAFVLGCSISYAEDSKPIPLDQIWALDMPGTRNVRELEPNIYGKQARSLSVEDQIELQEKSLVGQIRSELHWKNNKNPKRGFAVPGTGLAALKAARDVLTGEHQIADLLPAETDVSAVFSSLQFGHYVHIYDVERRGNVFEIRYRFVPHEYGLISENFALRPLGKLPRGMYQVKFTLGPMEERYLSTGFRPVPANDAERIVSGSFKFSTKCDTLSLAQDVVCD